MEGVETRANRASECNSRVRWCRRAGNHSRHVFASWVWMACSNKKKTHSRAAAPLRCGMAAGLVKPVDHRVAYASAATMGEKGGDGLFLKACVLSSISGATTGRQTLCMCPYPLFGCKTWMQAPESRLPFVFQRESDYCSLRFTITVSSFASGESLRGTRYGELLRLEKSPHPPAAKPRGGSVICQFGL